jgi:hypothetical protein
MLRHGSQHLGHHPVAAFTRSSSRAALQRLRHVGKGRAVAQAPGLRSISGM